MTVVPGTRDVLAVAGGDAVTFLQGQVSADVERLAAGESSWAFLLQPTGKLGFWLRVTRQEDRVLVDVDAGLGEGVAARLRRFLLRVDATVELLDWDSATVVGDGMTDAAATLGGELVLPRERRLPQVTKLVAVDVLGPTGSLTVPAEVGAAAELVDALVVAAWPSAAEMVEDSIPAELGQWVVDQSASFTKGCYTGQELVARVDSRSAETPFHLRVLVGDDSGPEVAPGDPVLHDGQDRGVVTSVGRYAGAPVALARVHRSVPVGASVLMGSNAATVSPPDTP
jgi:folate-binding protein YgfZ